MTQKGFNQLASTADAGVNFPPAGLTVHANKLQKESAQIKRVIARPTPLATGKISFEDVQEFLDTAYENGQIQQKANSKLLMDYGPLDEVLKNRRPK